MKTIGEHYQGATDERVTQTTYQGFTYRVLENLWNEERHDPHWAVTLTHSNISGCTDRHDIREHYLEQLGAIHVLGALDYHVHDADKTISFWRKAADIDTNDN